jgi:rhamnose transport system permease protein
MTRKIWTALALVVLVCMVTGFKEPRFFQPQSIESILLWMPLITAMAMGQLLVVLTGGIDISIGSILGFTGIAVGLILKSHPELSLPIVFGAGLGIGLALGLVNAVLIAYARISPLIVTIGSLATFRGLTFLLSKGDQIDSSMIPDRLTALAHTGIPIGPVTVSWLLIIALIVAAATAVFLRFTAAGRNIFAYGNHADAAYLRGISPRQVLLTVYSVCGALAGLAGVMYAARFGFVNPGSAGQNFELNVIAAVAIGGTKLTGGSGSVVGVLLGCLLLSCINVALSVLGIDANWQMLTYGAVIVTAILFDGSRRAVRAS